MHGATIHLQSSSVQSAFGANQEYVGCRTKTPKEEKEEKEERQAAGAKEKGNQTRRKTCLCAWIGSAVKQANVPLRYWLYPTFQGNTQDSGQRALAARISDLSKAKLLVEKIIRCLASAAVYSLLRNGIINMFIAPKTRLKGVSTLSCVFLNQ